MAFNLTTPITGQAQTGFTAPTYTIAVDYAPSALGKQWAVTALGGTQAGVTWHSASNPFTLTYFRPPTYKKIGTPNPSTGVVRDIGFNTSKLVGRKGMIPLAGQPPQIMEATLVMKVPAGADTASPAEIRALLSALFGAAVQQSAGIGDSLVSGIV